VDLFHQFWVLLLQVLQPKPGDDSISHRFGTKLAAYLRPNSMRVSLRNSPGASRARSPFVIFTAPV
jgi:hypothetical protein